MTNKGGDITNKISNKRLDELLELIIIDAYDFNESPTMTIDKCDVWAMASELLTARHTIQKLKELARELIEKYDEAETMRLYDRSTDKKDFKELEIKIQTYKALMEEIE